MSTILASLRHPKWGSCELLRVEGADWIVRFANGKLYRFPPGVRSQFTQIGSSESFGVPSAPASAAPSDTPPCIGLATLRHPLLGLGELLRIEVADWVVRFHGNGRTYRYPPAGRRHLTIVKDRTPEGTFSVKASASPPLTLEDAPEASKDPVVGPPHPAVADIVPAEKRLDVRTPQQATTVVPALSDERTVVAAPPSALSRQVGLRVIESLRNGLPPTHAEARQLAVGFEGISRHVSNLLKDVDDGGRVMVIHGQYGQGKTFALKLLEEMALEANFAVVRTEIDATENRLNKPHHIYRDLMAHLRVPGVVGNGLRTIAASATARLRTARPSASSTHDLALDSYRVLLQETGCLPLAWLMSDPDIAAKPQLLALLRCDPGTNTATARAAHRVRGLSVGIDGRPASLSKIWPAFSAGTQGDFASFLLSGLGRLCRFVGYRGLIVVLDEMEKWQDLNWQEQSQAGNLLGGLIWGATAEVGRRGDGDEPSVITHSRRAGGFPFTTNERNHVGLAIAMTPRGENCPEKLWQAYGLIEMAYLPELNDRTLAAYCGKIAPYYAAAYGLTNRLDGQVLPISRSAIGSWKRHGELTTRSGVQAAIAAFDHWRDSIASA